MAKPEPAFLSVFAPPNTATSNSNKTPLQEFNEAFEGRSNSNKTLTPHNESLSSSEPTSTRTSKKKRFARKPSRKKIHVPIISSVRRIKRKYSLKCCKENLLQLLNWKQDKYNYEKGMYGEIYDNGKILEKAGVQPDTLDIEDQTFPETIRDNFTNCLFDFKYDYDKKNEEPVEKPKLKLKEGVLTLGNRVQMWKLLIEKGENWHVCCTIWHNGEPYSFSFDSVGSVPQGVKYAKLACKSPSEYLEESMMKQKMKNPTLKENGAKYIELLATSRLDEHMIEELTNVLTGETNSYSTYHSDTIFQGFTPITEETRAEYEKHSDELQKAYDTWMDHLNDKTSHFGSKKTAIKKKPPPGIGFYATQSLPTLVKVWKNEPFQLSIRVLLVQFRDFYYCRKDPRRRSKRKNCMGSLDTIFQDVFSCRLFGSYIHPKLCGPKTKCITPDDEEESESSVSTENNTQGMSTTSKALQTISRAVQTPKVRSIVNKKSKTRFKETVVGGGGFKKRKRNIRSKKLRK